MAKRLDRDRPVTTVFPPHRGAHYGQDGDYFDQHGKIVVWSKSMVEARGEPGAGKSPVTLPSRFEGKRWPDMRDAVAEEVGQTPRSKQHAYDLLELKGLLGEGEPEPAETETIEERAEDGVEDGGPAGERVQEDSSPFGAVYTGSGT